MPLLEVSSHPFSKTLVLASPLVYYFFFAFFLFFFYFLTSVILILQCWYTLKALYWMAVPKKNIPVNNIITGPLKSQFTKLKRCMVSMGSNLNPKGKIKISLTPTKTNIPVVCCCFWGMQFYSFPKFILVIIVLFVLYYSTWHF